MSRLFVKRAPFLARTAALAAVCAALAGSLPAAAADVPAAKKTSLGLYVTAADAARAAAAEPDKILFLDVRTPSELMFVGSTSAVDANIPFVTLASPARWDEKNNRLQLEPNPAFTEDVKAKLAARSLTKADKVFLMCRSGERSARAVDTLAAAGFTNVWSVIDGFEGDLSKDGRRDVNGWKNAGLPWSYKLDKSKLDLAPAGAR